MSKSKLAISGGIIVLVILIIILSYWYSPLTQAGCEKLETKIRQAMTNASYCDLASDCSITLDTGCSFECASFFNDKFSPGLKGWLKRFQRRCGECEDECYLAQSNPACLEHTCTKSGGEVSIKTNKQEYEPEETINLEVTNNLKETVGYNFPISLCLRPTIIRLEKYVPETKEWLSNGVGLLFENDEVKFYKTPDTCSIYKLDGCTAEKANEFIKEEDLEIINKRNYSLPSFLVESCDDKGQENSSSLEGWFRIALYYERTDKKGEQIYSNEFEIINDN